MTKCIILGGTPPPTTLKPIQFIKHTTGKINGLEFQDTKTQPSDWGNVELICKAYKDESTSESLYYDIMFAYDYDSRNNGLLIMGYWNDGVVE